VDDRVREVALGKLRCPASGERLVLEGDELVTPSGKQRYALHAGAIPLLADELLSDAARRQREHYDVLAPLYLANLRAPHTEAYTGYLDGVLLDALGPGPLGDVAEICCGQADALGLVREQVREGVGVDVSPVMLEAAAARLPEMTFVQGDATDLPLEDASFDCVVMSGGVHHVGDRRGLFREVARVQRPGGRFVFREPLDDFPLWRWLRALIYRLSPALDAETERPLRWSETAPPLREAGLELEMWRPCGLLGFCIFMNGDVLVVNRAFGRVPGIAAAVRASARLDEWLLRLPGFHRAGLQLVARARKGPVI
jgi:SAM-dependent methyltransferase